MIGAVGLYNFDFYKKVWLFCGTNTKWKIFYFRGSYMKGRTEFKPTIFCFWSLGKFCCIFLSNFSDCADLFPKILQHMNSQNSTNSTILQGGFMFQRVNWVETRQIFIAEPCGNFAAFSKFSHFPKIFMFVKIQLFFSQIFLMELIFFPTSYNTWNLRTLHTFPN